jgi:hypothetical protein
MVAVLVRQWPTNRVYNTRGGVTNDEKLVTMAKKWEISSLYKRKLKAIGRRFHCALADVITCDQSFRTKRLVSFVVFVRCTRFSFLNFNMVDAGARFAFKRLMVLPGTWCGT